MSEPLLIAKGLRKAFQRNGEWIAAVDGIDLTIARGETLALVGPSGSGKSTVARLVLRLTTPDAGTITFNGQDFSGLGGGALRTARKDLQMVFQDPLAAFNPRATVARVLDDPLRIHRISDRSQRPGAIATLLERVGLPPALATRYIHEISGGQRQRVAIARAIATRPALIVLDEALSALDVSVRAGILDLLRQIQRNENVAYLFISHDLAIVGAVADRIAIMEAGRIVETGEAGPVLASPASQIGKALVAAIPRLKITGSVS